MNDKTPVPMDDKILAPSDEKMVSPISDEKMLTPVSDKIAVPATSDEKMSVSTGDGNLVWQKYEVLKSSNTGLVLPENLQLAINQIQPIPTTTQPVFMTSEMNWLDIMTVLPPWFELAAVTNPGDAHMIRPVVTVAPQGVQGVTGITVDIQLHGKQLNAIHPSAWQIKRSGPFSRSYKMAATDKPDTPRLIWKGSTKAATEVVDDNSPNCKGTLKLMIEADKKILAVWKQRRDKLVLGTINILEGATEFMSIEAVIASCLCCVMAERASGMNWFGGLGK